MFNLQLDRALQVGQGLPGSHLGPKTNIKAA